MRLILTNETALGSTVQLKRDQWEQLAAAVVLAPRGHLLAQMIRSRLDVLPNAKAIRIDVTADELAVLTNAAESA